jgi:hypothetical protein
VAQDLLIRNFVIVYPVALTHALAHKPAVPSAAAKEAKDWSRI